MLSIKSPAPADAAALTSYYHSNAAHLASWEPLREKGYHSIEAWQQRLSERQQQEANGAERHFVACLNSDQEIIATCSLTQIVRGPFQACYMGYSIAAAHQGQGLMQSVCRHAIAVAFDEMGLNRIMANYMPANRRSAALLNRLGFTEEGLAKKYLCINGRWEDHVLTSLLNPDEPD
jgi:[ribosomal protein S5]-alanine N-acetyltransferase